MKRFYSVRISSILIIFFIGALVFTVCATLGVRHAVLVSSVPSKTPEVIIIDAGHGGEDGGAVGANGALEKDINLAIALLLKNKLTDHGYSVVMIRENDTAVGDITLPTIAERKRSDIQFRANFVNEYKDCILISIHQNFFEQNQYTGAQMFYSKNNPHSLQLAEAIQCSIKESLQPENHRECKPADGIYLLEHVQAPSVIVECGFISNPTEADLLCDAAYQDEIATAICCGIQQFTHEE